MHSYFAPYTAPALSAALLSVSTRFAWPVYYMLFVVARFFFATPLFVYRAYRHFKDGAFPVYMRVIYFICGWLILVPSYLTAYYEFEDFHIPDVSVLGQIFHVIA